MYIYLVFVLIGILLFLLLNNKNKFRIGVPGHDIGSQSGDLSGYPSITASVYQIPDQVIQDAEDDYQLYPRMILPRAFDTPAEIAAEEATISTTTIATVCAAAVATFAGMVAALRFRNRNRNTELVPDTDSNSNSDSNSGSNSGSGSYTQFDIETPGP